MSLVSSRDLVVPDKCIRNCKSHEYGLYQRQSYLHSKPRQTKGKGDGWVLFNVFTTLVEAQRQFDFMFVRSDCEWKIKRLCIA